MGVLRDQVLKRSRFSVLLEKVLGSSAVSSLELGVEIIVDSAVSY